MRQQDLITPETVSVAPDREVWVARVPRLLNGVPDLQKYGLDTLEAGYLNVAQALANSAPAESALQLRLLSTGLRPQGELGDITAWIVGGARGIEDALVLWELVSTSFPAELLVRPGNESQCRRVLAWTDGAPRTGIADVRRCIDEGAPLPGSTPMLPLEPTVLPWHPHAEGLAVALPVLIRQHGRSALVLHMERTAPSEGLISELSRAHAFYQEAIQIGGASSREWLDRLSSITRKRLNVLPRSALSVRVALASTQPLRPGLVEAIGLTLCDLGGFEAVYPHTQADAASAEMLFGRAEAVSWAEHPDPVVAELHRIATPTEAAAVVRLPAAPQSGLPGIPCTPMMTLPRSPQGPPAGRHDGVQLGTSPHGGKVSLTLDELNQHTLVVGLPGFGKTNTVQEILKQLWTDHHIPFLVLDPAKSDYAALIDCLGDSSDRPQRIVLGPDDVAFNPFVVPNGCTVAAHAGRLLGAFDAALQISTRWPVGYTILSRGLFRAYEEAGPATAPTLRSVYAAVGDLIRSTPLDPGTRADVNASLLGRLESLVRGPLGASLLGGPRSGIDWDDLLARPTVVEFRGFAGPTERSLIFGLMIAGLASVRESRPSNGSGLRHVTVLEEAHRVLQDRGAAESEGVRLLAEAIAELRGSGEGFMVVDQTPSVLHPVIRKVCGSVISHRLIDVDDRTAIGGALLLDARQTQDLARVPVGQAVVYGAQRDASAVVDVSRCVRGGASMPPVTSLTPTPAQTHLFCVGCTTMCVYREVGRASAAAALEAGKSSSDVLVAEMMQRIGAGPLWCATAHMAARELRAAPPSALLSSLHNLRRTFVMLAQVGYPAK